MRNRAGVVLIENNAVALIERHRAGIHYFVFPGGGMDAGESPEAAAVREMEEETGLRVAMRQKLAVIHFGNASLQHYFLVERTGGEFGSGAGEEMSNLHPDDPNDGIYIPVWMPLMDLSEHDVYPAQIAALVCRSVTQGWPAQALEFFEKAATHRPPTTV
jgi:8-oxo-dGTP pyrophosphatase MutT (NUDIX family)